MTTKWKDRKNMAGKGKALPPDEVELPRMAALDSPEPLELKTQQLSLEHFSPKKNEGQEEHRAEHVDRLKEEEHFHQEKAAIESTITKSEAMNNDDKPAWTPIVKQAHPATPPQTLPHPTPIWSVTTTEASNSNEQTQSSTKTLTRPNTNGLASSGSKLSLAAALHQERLKNKTSLAEVTEENGDMKQPTMEATESAKAFEQKAQQPPLERVSPKKNEGEEKRHAELLEEARLKEENRLRQEKAVVETPQKVEDNGWADLPRDVTGTATNIQGWKPAVRMRPLWGAPPKPRAPEVRPEPPKIEVPTTAMKVEDKAWARPPTPPSVLDRYKAETIQRVVATSPYPDWQSINKKNEKQVKEEDLGPSPFVFQPSSLVQLMGCPGLKHFSPLKLDEPQAKIEEPTSSLINPSLIAQVSEEPNEKTTKPRVMSRFDEAVPITPQGQIDWDIAECRPAVVKRQRSSSVCSPTDFYAYRPFTEQPLFVDAEEREFDRFPAPLSATKTVDESMESVSQLDVEVPRIGDDDFNYGVVLSRTNYPEFCRLELYSREIGGRIYINVARDNEVATDNNILVARFRQEEDGSMTVRQARRRSLAIISMKIRFKRAVTLTLYGVVDYRHVRFNGDDYTPRRIWCDEIGFLPLLERDVDMWMERAPSDFQPLDPLRLVRIVVEAPHPPDDDAEMRPSDWVVNEVDCIPEEREDVEVSDNSWPKTLKRVCDLRFVGVDGRGYVRFKSEALGAKVEIRCQQGNCRIRTKEETTQPLEGLIAPVQTWTELEWVHGQPPPTQVNGVHPDGTKFYEALAILACRRIANVSSERNFNYHAIGFQPPVPQHILDEQESPFTNIIEAQKKLVRERDGQAFN